MLIPTNLSDYDRGCGGETRLKSARSGKPDFNTVRIICAGLIGLLVIVILIADLADGSSARDSSKGELVTLTEYELLSRAATIEPTPYWVGPQPDTVRFELEKDPEGNVYVRYATSSAARDPQAEHLTVASYPVNEAEQRLEAAAQEEKSEVLSRGADSIVLGSPHSDSAYVVFEERPELQVEVYSPQPGEALKLVKSGALTPLHWTPIG